MATRRAYGDSTEYFNTPTRGWVGLDTGQRYDAPKPGLEPMRKETNEEFSARLVIYDHRPKEPTPTPNADGEK